MPIFSNADLSAALDRIAERAADVRRAYTPGAAPYYDDVAIPESAADFTLDPLQVAAPDDVYFVTVDERGNRHFTRDGSFALRGGRLVDAAGHSVAGLSAGGILSELRVDQVDEALGRLGNASIDADGSFVYYRGTVDPRSGARESQRVVVGRVALARFPAGTRFESADGIEVAAPPGVSPQTGLPGDADFAVLAPMHRAHSRIDLDRSLIRLKEAYIAFDALQAAEAAKVHLGKTTMDLLK